MAAAAVGSMLGSDLRRPKRPSEVPAPDFSRDRDRNRLVVVRPFEVERFFDRFRREALDSRVAARRVEEDGWHCGSGLLRVVVDAYPYCSFEE